MNNRKKKLLKWMMKDEFNHEFNPILKEVEQKLDIKGNKVSLFLILLVYQYTFIFLLLLLMYNIRTSGIFLVVLVLISVFNLILPATIARTSIQRIEENPVFECLAMSGLSLNQSKQLMILSELGSFWIHNMLYELLSMCLLIIKFKGIGILYSIIWLIVVSFIFLRTLMKKANIHRSIISCNSLRAYIFSLVVSGFVTYNIYDLFICTLRKISMSEFFEPNGMSGYTRAYISRIMNDFKGKSLYLLILILVLFISYLLVRIWIEKVHVLKIEVLKTLFLKKYKRFIFKTTRNIFVERDLKRIFNILPYLNVNVFLVILPSGLIFLAVVSIFLVTNGSDQYATLISLDFVFWMVLYQSANFLVQKIPIFNISSELYNIELITMSNITMKQLIKSKHILLATFCSPLLLLVLIEKLLLIIGGCNPIVVMVSFIIDIGIFIVGIILVLKWTLILPKFDWDNIFMLKQDNFDSQILQQFLLVPSRIVTLYFSISFAFVNIVIIHYEISFMLLYYFLTSMGIVTMYMLLRRK